MAFSFSRRPVLWALGRNGCFIEFLVLFLLILFGALESALAHETRAQGVERYNFVGIAVSDRGARHSADYAGVFALRHGHSAGGLDGPQAFRAVIAHPGHDYSDRREPEFLRDGMKQNVRGWPVAVHWRAVSQR